MRHALIPVLAVAVLTVPAAAQRPTTEVDTTIGYSTEGISTAASQVRTFGDIRPGLRYYFEGMAAVRTDKESDAFGAAFPYTNGLAASETYVEQRLNGKALIGGLRAGRYRTPFGIYDRGDYAYNGFLRPPLVRWGAYNDVSNYWLESGVDAFAATHHGLQMELSLGTPSEAARLQMRRRGLDVAARLQAHRGSLIAGVSYLKTQPDTSKPWVRGKGQFGGIDARWMRGGLQLRGEVIWGNAFDNSGMRGWYLDATAHRRGLGPVTPVLRLEEYRYWASRYRTTWKRFTVGARIKLNQTTTLQINLLHQPELTPKQNTAVDVGLTHTVRL
jgi:hypothetical protein